MAALVYCMGTKVPDAKGLLLGLNSVGKWAIVLCSPSGQTQTMVRLDILDNEHAWMYMQFHFKMAVRNMH